MTRAVRLLQGDCRLVLFAGGATGRLLLETLADESLSVLAVPVAAPTRFGLYLFGEPGDREASLLGDRRWRCLREPAPEVSGEECHSFLEAVSSVLQASEWLCVAGSAPGQAGGFLPAELTRMAREAGVRVLLAATGQALKEALPRGPEVLKLSRAEATRTFGPEASPESLFLDLRRAGGRTLLLTDGGAPVLVFHDRSRWVLEPPRIAPVNPSTAGECLVAGFLEAMEEGWDLGPALAFAVAAGTTDAARLFPCGIDRGEVENCMRRVRVRR